MQRTKYIYSLNYSQTLLQKSQWVIQLPMLLSSERGCKDLRTEWQRIIKWSLQYPAFLVKDYTAANAKRCLAHCGQDQALVIHEKQSVIPAAHAACISLCSFTGTLKVLPLHKHTHTQQKKIGLASASGCRWSQAAKIWWWDILNSHWVWLDPWYSAELTLLSIISVS